MSHVLLPKPANAAPSGLSCDEADAPGPANAAPVELSYDEADAPRSANVAPAELSCDEADASGPANVAPVELSCDKADASPAGLPSVVTDDSMQMHLSDDCNAAHRYSSSLTICYFNARSIVNKMKNLQDLLESCHYDVILITETWLKPKVLDSMLCIANYNIIRRDRVSKKGGGVLAIFRSTLSVSEVRKTENEFFEFLCIDIKEHNQDQSLRLLCMYIPPDTAHHLEVIKDVFKCIALHRSNRSKLFILGDFNMPSIDWKTLTSPSRCGKLFLDFCSSNSLKQHISEPTTIHNSTLDLFLCDEFSANILQSVKVLPPMTTSCDHSTIEVSLLVDNSRYIRKNLPKTYQYAKGDYATMNQKLQTINWERVFYDLKYDIQLIYDYFLDLLHLLVHMHVPMTPVRKSIKRPRFLSTLAKRKHALYKQSKTNQSLRQKYKQLSKEYDEAVSSWYDHIESKICNSGRSSNFFRYANKKLNSYPSIPPLQTVSGLLITDDTERADLLNEVFQSNFTEDDGNAPHIPPRHLPSKMFSIDSVDESTISTLLQKLTNKSTRTPDNLPEILLKNLRFSITKFLCMFFALSLQRGQTPSQWKTAIVVPIYKKAAKNNPRNYRPISLTSVICRLMEKFICSLLLSYLLSHDLLSHQQHGFLPGRSTNTQLLEALNDWMRSFNSKETTAIVYTDLSKAFDTVSHAKLLDVVASYGVDSKFLIWLESFLSDRKQYVSINNCLSKPLNVHSGVPQGSVIGPLLFLLYIDDVCKLSSEETTVCLFADDTKVYSTNQKDLQQVLNDIVLFFQDRQLRLAPDKCEYLRINAMGTINNDFSPCINGNPLPRAGAVKDLGVIISSDLKWHQQINTLKKRGCSRSYHILKSFHSKNIWTLLKAFNTFVRPILEYASQIWSPYLKEDVKAIESVQRSFTKKICRRCNIPNRSYADRLAKLNIRSLEYRRLENDITMVYKIIHKLVDLPFDRMFEFYKSPYETRRHKYHLKLESYNYLAYKHTFANRAARVWNDLPAELVSTSPFLAFKKRLKSFDLTTVHTFTDFN